MSQRIVSRAMHRATSPKIDRNRPGRHASSLRQSVCAKRSHAEGATATSPSTLGNRAMVCVRRQPIAAHGRTPRTTRTKREGRIRVSRWIVDPRRCSLQVRCRKPRAKSPIRSRLRSPPSSAATSTSMRCCPSRAPSRTMPSHGFVRRRRRGRARAESGRRSGSPRTSKKRRRPRCSIASSRACSTTRGCTARGRGAVDRARVLLRSVPRRALRTLIDALVATDELAHAFGVADHLARCGVGAIAILSGKSRPSVVPPFASDRGRLRSLSDESWAKLVASFAFDPNPRPRSRLRRARLRERSSTTRCASRSVASRPPLCRRGGRRSARRCHPPSASDARTAARSRSAADARGRGIERERLAPVVHWFRRDGLWVVNLWER